MGSLVLFVGGVMCLYYGIVMLSGSIAGAAPTTLTMLGCTLLICGTVMLVGAFIGDRPNRS